MISVEKPSEMWYNYYYIFKGVINLSRKVLVFLYITIIVVALSVIAIVMILTPKGNNFNNDVTNSFGDGVSVERENPIAVTQNTTRLAQTNPADDDYLKDIVFIGDSRTVALQFNGIDVSQIFAENGLTHEQALTQEVVWLNDSKLTTIEEAVTATAPNIAIINFGINGAAWMDNNTFITGYERFLDSMLEASPVTIFIIEGIMPVSAEYELREDGILNSRIDELNEELYNLAKRKGVFYLATNEALKGENSNSLNDGYSSDGLHYNSDAYAIILDYIKSHAIYRK